MPQVIHEVFAARRREPGLGRAPVSTGQSPTTDSNKPPAPGSALEGQIRGGAPKPGDGQQGSAALPGPAGIRGTAGSRRRRWQQGGPGCEEPTWGCCAQPSPPGDESAGQGSGNSPAAARPPAEPGRAGMEAAGPCPGVPVPGDALSDPTALQRALSPPTHPRAPRYLVTEGACGHPRAPSRERFGTPGNSWGDLSPARRLPVRPPVRPSSPPSARPPAAGVGSGKERA